MRRKQNAIMTPGRRVAIRTFDYFAALAFGATAALSSWYLIPDLLPTPLAMVAGMAVGLAAAFPLLGLFSFLLGGFEILVMSLQIGMFAGMMGPMVGGDALGPVAIVGALTGFAVQFLLHMTDRALHGEVTCLD